MSPILMLTADTSIAFTSTVVIAGISIVLGVLLLLILVFYLFGAIVQKLEKMSKGKNKKAVESKPVVPAPIKPVIPQPNVEKGISGEVVAAIAAAVVASEGPTAVIRSIKKKNVGGRNPWAQAADIDNTRPF